MVQYLRTNYRLTGGLLDPNIFANSYLMHGEHTTSIAQGSYYTDIATLIGFTGSILFFKAHRKWISAPSSAGEIIDGHLSTGAATCLAVLKARGLGGATSGAEVSMKIIPTVSIATATFIVTWDALVISHY